MNRRDTRNGWNFGMVVVMFCVNGGYGDFCCSRMWSSILWGTGWLNFAIDPQEEKHYLVHRFLWISRSANTNTIAEQLWSGFWETVSWKCCCSGVSCIYINRSSHLEIRSSSISSFRNREFSLWIRRHHTYSCLTNTHLTSIGRVTSLWMLILLNVLPPHKKWNCIAN